MSEKKLVRSANHKKICGVCAGVADYFNLDPTIVRLIWALLILLCGTGLLAYFVAALILPKGDTKE